MPLPTITLKSELTVEVTDTTKERPRCRRAILALCRKLGLTAAQLLERVKAGGLHATAGMKKQLRLMAWEDYCKGRM
jgi:hypothetical protein